MRPATRGLAYSLPPLGNLRAMLGELANIASSGLRKDQKQQVRRLRLAELAEFQNDALRCLPTWENG